MYRHPVYSTRLGHKKYKKITSRLVFNYKDGVWRDVRLILRNNQQTRLTS